MIFPAGFHRAQLSLELGVVTCSLLAHFVLFQQIMRLAKGNYSTDTAFISIYTHGINSARARRHLEATCTRATTLQRLLPRILYVQTRDNLNSRVTTLPLPSGFHNNHVQLFEFVYLPMQTIWTGEVAGCAFARWPTTPFSRELPAFSLT